MVKEQNLEPGRCPSSLIINAVLMGLVVEKWGGGGLLSEPGSPRIRAAIPLGNRKSSGSLAEIWGGTSRDCRSLPG